MSSKTNKQSRNIRRGKAVRGLIREEISIRGLRSPTIKSQFRSVGKRAANKNE